MRSWPCPCGDQRDFEFANKFGLPIPAIQQPPEAWFEERDIELAPGTALDTSRLAGSVRRRRPLRPVGKRQHRSERHRQHRRRRRGDERVARGERCRRGNDQLQAARPAVQQAALLGRAISHRVRRRRSAARAPRFDVAGRTARDRVVLAADVRRRRRVLESREPARPAAGLGERRTRSGRRTRRADVPTRHQRDAAVGRVVLVRDALPRSDERATGSAIPRRAVLDGPAAPMCGPTIPVASTCTSAASSTPCCTCSTPASGTRCSSTSATSARSSRTPGCSTRATSRPHAFKDDREIYVEAS